MWTGSFLSVTDTQKRVRRNIFLIFFENHRALVGRWVGRQVKKRRNFWVVKSEKEKLGTTPPLLLSLLIVDKTRIAKGYGGSREDFRKKQTILWNFAGHWSLSNADLSNCWSNLKPNWARFLLTFLHLWACQHVRKEASGLTVFGPRPGVSVSAVWANFIYCPVLPVWFCTIMYIHPSLGPIPSSLHHDSWSPHCVEHKVASISIQLIK